MAKDEKQTKAAPAQKNETVTQDKTASAEGSSKSASAESSSKTEGGEKSTTAPANYSRGEGQKPVTAAYKENWNLIFSKKNKKRKKR